MTLRERAGMKPLIWPGQNGLLAVLPDAEFARILPQLEPLALPLGTNLYEADQPFDHVYFPTSAIVSIVHVLSSGASTELACIGNEGMVGISILLGGDTTPHAAVVRTAGAGYRLSGRVLKDEFGRAGFIRHLMLRYTQAMLAQVGQTVVCNRNHSICQQLCRWLLSTLDRLPGSSMAVTQELVASAIGVRREGITEAAGKLQRDGLIGLRRGHITVLDRHGLESRACECYAVVRAELARLMDDIRCR